MTISLRTRRRGRRLLPILCWIAATGGARTMSGEQDAHAQQTGPDSAVVEVRGRRIPTRLHTDLTEASAAVMSRAQPDRFWSINDSGNEPMLFLVDTTGRRRGVWRVRGARNVDWEAAALGPCGTGGGAHCLYIGDVGDNGAVRRAVTVYRVSEPLADGRRTMPAQALTFRYPDRAHDVEAMYVMPNGTMYFITKRPLKDSAGRLRRALVFSLPASAWNADSVVTAELIDSLPIVPGTGPIRMITDAALAPDSRHLAVRTYTEMFVFAIDPESGRVLADVRPTVCDLSRLRERQGEAVTWLNATGRLLLMSEGRRDPLWAIECPTPLPTEM